MRTLLPILALLVPLTVGLGQGASPPAKAAAAKGGGRQAGRTGSLGTEVPSPRHLPPKTGSHIPPDDNLCIQCHGDPDLWDAKTKRLYVDRKGLADDVHWKKGVNCSDCHGGDPKTVEPNVAHATENGFRRPAATAWKMCAVCHESQALDLVKSVHDKAGPKDEQGRGTPLECRACHGPEQHHILPVARQPLPGVRRPPGADLRRLPREVSRPASPRPSTATACTNRGLLVTATCASCHGAHGIYYAADDSGPRSIRPMWPATCGKCHRFIAERLKTSIHGRGKGPGQMAERPAPGRNDREHPTLHLLPPGARDRPGRIGPVPPARAQSLRQLPRATSPAATP